MENKETERSFFLDYADNYLNVTDQRSELSRSTWEKGKKAHNGRMKAKPFTKNFSPIPRRFSCRN